MKVEFLESPVSFRPDGHPGTPYQRAQQVWDDRLGSATVRAANWRRASFISATLCLVLASANLYQVVSRKIVPFVITVNGETGEPKVVGRIESTEYRPAAAEIRYFLTQIVRNIRALPLDPVVVKENWLRSYHFFTPECATLLNTRTNSEEGNPLKAVGEKTVTVQPLTVNQIGQSNSYQIRWNEEVFDKRGGRIDSYTMTGVFVIQIEPPRDETVLNVNPLGIYVKDFQWSRDLS